MPRTFSRPAGGLAASVLVGAALMLVASPAGASSATVSFQGSSLLGLPALSCDSKPDSKAFSLTPTDTLDVQNLTGHTAVIYVNGRKSGSSLGPNQSAPITSAKGYTVALLPDCLLNLSDAGSVSVTIVAPAPAVVPPAPTTAPVATSAGTSDSGSPRSVTPSKSTTVEPKHTAASGKTVSDPASASTSGSRTPKPSRSATSIASAGSTGSNGSSGGAAGTSTSQPSDGNTGSTTTQAGGSTDGVNIGAAQTLPVSESLPATPNYLLVVIAFILVVGVGCASLRAVFTQRRTRRAMA